VLEISVQSPPILRFGRNNADVSMTVNELQVTAFYDYMDNKAPLELFTLQMGLQLTLDVDIQNNEIVLSDLQARTVRADMLNEIVDLNDLESVRFFKAILPTLLKGFSAKLPRIAIPTLPLGLSLNNPRFEFQRDFFVVRGDL
jgi:hypothetical protein